MGNTSEAIDECAVCLEKSPTLYQCCPRQKDSLCESCWSRMISSVIKKGKIGLLFNGKLPCECCDEPIDRTRLPTEVQTQINSIFSTIPKTKNPQTVEEFNYSYKNSKELRHCLTDEKFIFLTQRHYNLLGGCIDTYIQSVMKGNPWNYEEIWLPMKDENTNDHHDQVNIFVSNDFHTNENGCLILLQGSGVVRPGQWARSCCINDSLDIGSMFPYMIKAKEHNLSVLILNPNQTSYIEEEPTSPEHTTPTDKEEGVSAEGATSADKEEGVPTEGATSADKEESIADEDFTDKKESVAATATNNPDDNKEDNSLTDELISFYLSSNPLPRPLTKKIPNLSTNREHVLYVYDNILSKCRTKNFYIVAHSAGGDGLMYLLRKRQDEILPKLTKIAFTDSVHSILPFESNEIRSFLKSHAIHFVASDDSMGTPVDHGYDFSSRPACQEVSAGHPKHEYTSGCCVEGVFEFFFPSVKSSDDKIDSTKF